MLRDWILTPAEPDQISQRQLAVKELAPLLELREEFNIQGSLLADCKTGPAEFIAWAEGEPWLRGRPWLLWAARLLPILGVAIIVAAISFQNGFAVKGGTKGVGKYTTRSVMISAGASSQIP